MESDNLRKTVFLSIKGRRPPSHQPFYAGMHWAKRAQIARDWHQIVQLTLAEYGYKKMLLKDCHITITARMAEKLIDASNVCGKLLEDGLKRYQTSRKKVAKFTKVGKKTKIIDKIQIEGLENERYLFQDDCWPFVVSVTTAVVPADEDSISIEIDGVEDR